MIDTRGYFATPPVVKNLLIINVLVFLAEILLPGSIGDRVIDVGALHFWKGGDFKLFQLVTYMFLHANFSHLFFNMFALWMFGRILEYDLGAKRFLIYYMVCGIGAGLIQLGVNWAEWGKLVADGSTLAAQRIAMSQTIGASGAIFGVLLAYGLIHPNNVIMLMFPPIPLKAKWFVIGYGVLELLAGVSGSGGSVAHFAHLGGMLWGWLLLVWWKRKGKIYY